MRPTTSLVTDNGKQIVVNFHLDGFNVSCVNTPRGTQNIITVPGMASMLQAGAPDLPHYAIPSIIGDKAEMQVNIAKAKYTDYENVEIAPSKGNLSRQVNPDDVPYTYGEAYSINAFFPATQAYLEKPYIARDFRGQNIMVTPFAYNPVTKTLRVYTDLTIEMNKVSDNGVNPKTRNYMSHKMAPENKAEYSHRFINFNEKAPKYTFIEDRGEMLIICPEQYMEALQPLVEWKNISGRPTTIVSLIDAGGNIDTVIKSYIQSIYNDASHNLRFVLLVGDYSDLTPHKNNNDGYSDIWFGQLEGDDYYPEVLVGRFAGNNVNDIVTQVNKVIYYEREMPEGQTWLNKGIGIAKNEGGGQGHNGGESDFIHMNFIRDTLLHYTYESVSQRYAGVGNGTTSGEISADINEGASILNYCNHGTATSWSVTNYNNSNIKNLTNYKKWPYIISTACYNGQFNTDCFAETWLKSTSSTGEPIGAVGGLFSWTKQPWAPPMTGQDEINNIITEWRGSDKFNHTMGGAFLNGSSYILDMHPSDNGKTFNTWILFGDPSLMLRTDNPTALNTTTDKEALMIGETHLTANAQTDFGIATLSLNGKMLGMSYIENGSATIEIEPLNEIGTAKLVVTGFNKATYEKEIEIIPADGSYLALTEYTPHNALIGKETPLSLTIKNLGAEQNTANTTVTLSSDNENITFNTASSSFSTLNPNEKVTLDNFRFTTDAEDGSVIPITVTIENSENTWTYEIELTVGKVTLEYQHHVWVGRLEPGLPTNVAAVFKNNGHYISKNARATISTTNKHVTFDNPTVEYGNIIPNGTATFNFAVTIDEQYTATDPISLHFSLTDDDNNTAEGDAVLEAECDYTIIMRDSYGDGWNNGASLTLLFDNGTPDTTIYMPSKYVLEHIIPIKEGTTVNIVFNGGTLSSSGQSYDKECSFSVLNPSNEVIFNCAENSLTGRDGDTITSFVSSCSGCDNIFINLTVTENGNNAVLSWATQTRMTPNRYNIHRTDKISHIATTAANVTTYTDHNLANGTYYYFVEAIYDKASITTNPVKVEITHMGIDTYTSNINVYPNPATNKIFVQGENIRNISLYNTMGQAVLKQAPTSDQTEISVGNIPAGLYFIQIATDKGISTQRIVVGK